MTQKHLMLLLILAVSAPISAAQMVQGGSAGVIPSGFGGAYYSASRTDTTFLSYPATVPSVGAATGAGSCIQQPGYGPSNEVCRVTDINTQGQQGAGLEHFHTCCGGWADLPAWSADSRFFFLVNNAGGGVFLMELDDSVDPPVITNVWPSGKMLTASGFNGVEGSASLAGSWDRTDPDVFYSFGTGTTPCPGSDLCIDKWMWANPSLRGTVQPTPSLLVDLNTQPNCSFPSGASLKEFFASEDGSVFYSIVSTDIQDNWNYIIVWNKTLGCRTLDLKTWTFGGNYGPTGQVIPAIASQQSVVSDSITTNVASVTLAALPANLAVNATLSIQGTTNCSGALNVAGATVASISSNTITFNLTAPNCASASDTGIAFLSDTLHSLRGSLDGTTVMIGSSASSALNRIFWTFNGTSVVAGAANFATSPNIGHFTDMYSHFFFAGPHTAASGFPFCQPGAVSLLFSDAANPFSQKNYLGNLTPCPNGGNVAPDNHPSSSNSPITDNFPIINSSYDCCHPGNNPPTVVWESEVLGYPYTDPRKVFRFGSTYGTSDDSQSDFNCQEMIGTVSPNGKWFIFTSDWNNTLGLDSSSLQRCDVFAMRLR